MSGASDSVNSVDPSNSTTTPLGASGAFQGTFNDVTAYASISVLVHSDRASATNGFILQWSTNGTDVDDQQTFNYAGSVAEQGKVVHAAVRAKFFRLRYVNTSLVQTFLRIQTLLRRGSPQGSVSSLGLQPSQQHDAVSVNAQLVARQVDSPSTLVLPFASGDPFLIATPPPNSSVVQNETTVIASLAAVNLDLGFFGSTRHHFHVFNDTVRGNLHIRFGSAPSISNFNVKVPPRHFWELPTTWRRWPGNIQGIWDVADGAARCTEWF